MKNRSSSKTDEALKLAEEIKQDILRESYSLTNILRKSLILAQLLGRDNDSKWISYELNGYNTKETPNYRKCTIHCSDDLISPSNLLVYLKTHPLSRPIPILEEYVEKGFTVIPAKDNWYDTTYVIRPIEIKQTRNAVKNRVLNFANNVSIELKYDCILSGIFDETSKFVDSKLVELSPTALEKITETYEDLAAGSSKLDWTQIALACREILMDFTDAIFNEEYLHEGEEKPSRNQTIKKLDYTLRAAKVKSKTTKEMLESQMEYLLNYFDTLSDYIQKNVHPDNFKVTKEDANHCVIYTYLLIGDVLKLLHLGKVERRDQRK